jgi:hypothetical protein
MYTRFVWWLYDVFYGNETIEREEGDEEVYQRVQQRYLERAKQWAAFWRVS